MIRLWVVVDYSQFSKWSLGFVYSVIYLLFAISWAAPAAYGDSQARGLIGAVAAGLHHSHSNAGSVCDLHHSSRQQRILNPLSEARN